MHKAWGGVTVAEHRKSTWILHLYGVAAHNYMHTNGNELYDEWQHCNIYQQYTSKLTASIYSSDTVDWVLRKASSVKKTYSGTKALNVCQLNKV